MLAARDPLRFDDLPAGEVGAADVAHLACADDIVERAHRLLDRRLRVGEVHLQHVDVVDAEAAQARVGRLEDVAARCAGPERAVAHGAGELRGDHDVAERTHRFFDRRLRVREVHLDQVDVVDAETAQARIDGFEHVAPRRTGPQRSVAHRPGELRSDDDIAAAALQRNAEELL